MATDISSMYRELGFTITCFLDLSFRLCCCVAVNLSTRDIAARTKSRLAVTNCRKTGMSSRTLQNRGVYERCYSCSFWTLWKFIVCSVGPKAAYQTHLPTVDFYFAGSTNWTSLLPTSSSVLMSVKRSRGSMRRILLLEAMTMATR